jgi:hypothetical protein
VDCSFVQFNSKANLALLRKGLGRKGSLHQLAEEFSDESPVDYTLETSRAGGKATTSRVDHPSQAVGASHAWVPSAMANSRSASVRTTRRIVGLPS